MLEIVAMVAISGIGATAVATLIGVPIAGLSGTGTWGRILGDLALALTRVLTPLLAVVCAALALSGWRLDITFTPTSMVVAQAALGLVVVAGSTARAVRDLPSAAFEQLEALQLGRAHSSRLLVAEVLPGLVRSAFAAFSTVTAVLGSVLIAGGRLAGESSLATSILVDGRRPGQAAGLLLVGLSMVVATAAVWRTR